MDGAIAAVSGTFSPDFHPRSMCTNSWVGLGLGSKDTQNKLASETHSALVGLPTSALVPMLYKTPISKLTQN